MKYREAAHTWQVGSEALVGIASLPEHASDLGIVIIVGGPQYRVGSHRQFALLAREMAAAGFPALRFDVRGMGDSEGEARSFEQLDEDVASAIAALQSLSPSVRRVALWGLCDGASAALLYLNERDDPRVAGLALLNPWVRSVESLARTQVKHYYTQRLLQLSFWKKLLSGGVALGALSGLARNLTTAFRRSGKTASPSRSLPFQARMAASWASCKRPILLILSREDYTAKEFLDHVQQATEWRGALHTAHLTRHDCEDADHTFSSERHRSEVAQMTRNWLSQVASQSLK